MGAPGILSLPSGRLVRGRGLNRPLLNGARPEFGVYLLNKRPEPVSWESRWVRWPDFRLPTDRHDAQDGLREAWKHAANERVELACVGGRGRTGTALACLAVLDGVPPSEAVAYVREHYGPTSRRDALAASLRHPLPHDVVGGVSIAEPKRWHCGESLTHLDVRHRMTCPEGSSGTGAVYGMPG